MRWAVNRNTNADELAFKSPVRKLRFGTYCEVYNMLILNTAAALVAGTVTTLVGPGALPEAWSTTQNFIFRADSSQLG